jgi:PAS domain S-box-containing protein
VGVLAIASFLLYGELTRRERQGLLAAKATAANMVADLFASSLAAPLDFADQDAIDGEMSHLAKNPEVICAAIFGKSDGAKALARLDRGCDATRPITQGDLSAPVVSPDQVEVARSVDGRSGRVGRARIVFSLARENAAFEASRTRIFLLSLALAIGTTLLLLGITRREIITPLRKLTDAARRLGRGELGTRVALARADETGQLASAFNWMGDAIQDREERLAAATQSLRELFDNMAQAILAFDRDGIVRGEASKQTQRFFGYGVEGKKVADLLYGDKSHEVDAHAFEEFRALAFEIDVESWAELAELAPREAKIARKGKVLPVEIEFRPVVREGKIERVMLLATDVSEKKRLEETALALEEEHARRIAAMRRLVAGGANLFVAFTENAREQVAACLAILGPVPRELSRPELDVVFRRVHTMKGEARSFDLAELEKELGELEERLRGLRDAAVRAPTVATGTEHAALVSGLGNADDAILRAREDFVAVSPIGRAALDQMTVQRSDVEELRGLVARAGEPASGARIAALVERLAARRFGESLATLVDQVPLWAEREGKQVELELDGRDVRVPPSLSRALGGVLGHLVRNAVAHGIETPLDRTKDGKEPVGVVRIVAADGERGPVITVEDDGRGLDEGRIRDRARDLGLDAERSPAELVFASGLSTRDATDDLGGLGVGLDAVKSDLAAVGYAVSVESTPGKLTRFVLAPSPGRSNG